MKLSTTVLRAIAALIGVALVVWSVTLYTHGSDAGAAAVITIEGVLIVVGVVFERRRYQPKIEPSTDRWQTTDEKFIDPGTGKLMQVLFDPKTGERNYIEVPAGRASVQ